MGTRPGRRGLPRVTIADTRGASAEVYLHGAHVTSWRTADGVEQLYLSERARFDAREPIRGGIPVIFPQFAGEGALPKHGIARTAPWDLIDASPGGDAPFALLRLSDSEASRSVWPHAFVAEIRVALEEDALRVTLAVTNPGGDPFAFTTALHTYLRVSHAPATAVIGLHGREYRDSADGGRRKREEGREVSVGGGVNRIYRDVTGPLRIREPHRERMAAMAGFRDAVIWNPGPAGEAALADMEPGDSRVMVCVEAAVVESPVLLRSGERWEGFQRISTSET